MTARKTARPSRVWSPSESQTAAQIWDRAISDHYGDDAATFPPGIVKRTLQRIAASIGRDFAIVEYRHRHCGPSFGANRRAETLKVLAERDLRTQALFDASLTTRLFGDPPPGFSALDRRRA